MNDEWETPPELFNKLNEEFNFWMDLCTKDGNSRCEGMGISNVRSFVDSFKPWLDRSEAFWMNPPYSRGNINECTEAAYDLSCKGQVVVSLVRFDPTAGWFKNFVDGKATEVRMLDKRVKFRNAKDSYNFPCCAAIYLEKEKRRHTETDYYIWGWK